MSTSMSKRYLRALPCLYCCLPNVAATECSTTRTAFAPDETPDDIRRKLTLLEGDRKAYYESSQQAMSENRALINSLRKENKTIAAKLKQLKKPATSSRPEGAQAIIKEQISTAIKKRNTLRHQVKQKESRLIELKKKSKELAMEEKHERQNTGGKSAESQRVRQLENSLDKANIKAQEAQHIKRTYQQIIQQLERDRLQFDAAIAQQEAVLKQRKQEVVDLDAMCNDACLARDRARQQLASKEAELAAKRAEREQEKGKLSALADERRRQYEAMEKRMRLAASGQNQTQDNGVSVAETASKLETYEDAMRRIRDATGTSEVADVVQRFLSQASTQEHLRAMQVEHTETLQKLKDEHSRKQKQYEALKYSGEARNTGNQRMLTEFEQHLTDAERKRDTTKEVSERCQKTLVELSAGIDALYEKLGTIKPVQFRAASTVKDRLVESELRLKKLFEELQTRKADLPGGLSGDSIPRVLPQHNTRVVFDNDSDPEEDELEDDEFISRDAMKKQAHSLVEAKTAKKRKKKN